MFKGQEYLVSTVTSFLGMYKLTDQQELTI